MNVSNVRQSVSGSLISFDTILFVFSCAKACSDRSLNMVLKTGDLRVRRDLRHWILSLSGPTKNVMISSCFEDDDDGVFVSDPVDSLD